jgi:hypothetical protein
MEKDQEADLLGRQDRCKERGLEEEKIRKVVEKKHLGLGGAWIRGTRTIPLRLVSDQAVFTEG